jgi:hypothetical protein
LPRKKKTKPLEKFFAWIEAKAKDASIRDLCYLTSYLGAVYIAYEAITGDLLTAILELEFNLGLGVDPFAFKPKEAVEFKPKAFATALVVAYMVLKIDVDDVASAVGKLGKAALTGLTTLSSVP